MPFVEGLSEKQERFCQEYMVDFNGTRAAIAAGYSAESASVIAAENLVKPKIAVRLAQLKKEAAESFGVSKQQLIDELKKTAFFDIRTIYTDNNALKDVKDFDDNAAGAIAGIEVDELFGFNDEGERTKTGITTKVKTNSKLGAIERISKMLGFDAPTKGELSGPNGTPLVPPVQQHTVVFKKMSDDNNTDTEPNAI